MNTIKSVSTCNNRKCQVKWGDGKNERAKWLAWSFTLSGHVEMTDKDLFCPEIPHFIFKPGNWLVISIQNTSCPGARWWQQSAKFSSCLHSVNWVIHGIKNSNEPWKKKIWLTEALKDIQWEQVWLFHRRGIDSAMKKKKMKENNRQYYSKRLFICWKLLDYSSIATKYNSSPTPGPKQQQPNQCIPLFS